MIRIRTMALAVLVAACLTCGPHDDAADAGDVVISTTVNGAITGGRIIPVGAVWVHVWGMADNGRSIDEWYRLTASGTRYTCTIKKIASGSYLAHGKAFTDAAASVNGVADYESVDDVAVRVAAKQTTSAALTLQQNTTRWPPDAVDNATPVVDSLVVSASAIDSNGPSPVPVTLRAAASDPDGADDITGYEWAAAYAPPLGAWVTPGRFSAPAALETTWTPPVGYEGVVTFSFTVKDRRLASSTVTMAVAVSKKFGPGSVVVTVAVNNWPDILGLATTDGQLLPGDPDPTSFTVVALDPDGDDLHFEWDDGGCGGSFGSPNAATTTYLAGPTERACPITVAVTDFVPGTSPPVARGGRTASTLTIDVRTVPTSYGPTFTFAARSGAADLEAAPGTVLSFSVEAVQVIVDPLTFVPVTTFTWHDGLGGVFTPVGGDAGNVRWATPACAALSPPYRVEVVVEAIGLPSTGSPVTPLSFQVLVACP